MKIATNIKRLDEFGFQIILNESNQVIGINLLLKRKIMLKHRFKNARETRNSLEEKELVHKLLIERLQLNQTKI